MNQLKENTMCPYPSLFFALLLLHMWYTSLTGWVYDKSLHFYIWILDKQREGHEIINQWKNINK